MKSILTGLIFILLSSICQAEIVLEDNHGQKTTLSDLKGKWVYINYWAGWCQTCVDEIPEFNRFYKKHKNDQVVLFGVNYDSLPLFERNSLINRFAILYPNLLNDPAKVLNLGDIRGVPVTFIFNPEGTLVDTLYGGQSAKTLEKVMSEKQSKV